MVGTTCCNQIVDHDDTVRLLQPTRLQFKDICAILLFIFRLHSWTGQFALFTDWDKADVEAERQSRSDDKAPGIEANEHGWFERTEVFFIYVQLALLRSQIFVGGIRED